jgi:hypothetical protein
LCRRFFNGRRSVDPSDSIVSAVIISLTLMQINQRLASPLISIIDRWLRWFVFAFGAAQICAEFNWIDRPFWVLATVFFIVWFLGETVYNWMLITAESLSPLPLFPRYVLNTSGEEWPVQRRLLKVREVVEVAGISPSAGAQGGNWRGYFSAGLRLPGRFWHGARPSHLPAAGEWSCFRVLRDHFRDR